MLKIFYTSIVIVINLVYYLVFFLIVSDLGLKNSDRIIFNGSMALIFFNSVTFLTGLYFFKKTSDRFKFINKILFVVLISVAAFPLLYILYIKVH